VTTTHAVTFGDATYGVEGLPVVELDGVEHLGVGTSVLAKVEEAIALAALEDGCYRGDVARYARKVLGFTIAGLATHCGVEEWAIRDNETLAGLSRAWPLAEVLTLLRAADRGGFVARRVTV